AGEHQALFRHVAHGGAAPAVVDETHAHVDPVDAGDLRYRHGLYRIRQGIIQSGIGIPGVLAEAEHDAPLIGLDLEEAGDGPEHEHGERDQHEAFAAEPAGQHGPELVLAAPQQLLEVGRRRSARLRAGAPRPLGARTPGSAALITPRHGISPQARRPVVAGQRPRPAVIGEPSSAYNARWCRAAVGKVNKRIASYSRLLRCALVSRFRSSPEFAARSEANFGI